MGRVHVAPSFLHLWPGYTAESMEKLEQSRPTRIKPGSVILVEVRDSGQRTALERRFPRERWKIPAAPFVLWAPVPFDGRLSLAHRAGRLGFRAVFGGERIERTALEMALPRELDLDQILDWLLNAIPPKRLINKPEVRRILEEGASGGHLRNALDDLCISPRVVQRRLARVGWPSPSTLLRLGRALAALGKVQARPTQEQGSNKQKSGRGVAPANVPNLAAIAYMGGFADDRHLRREYVELFGHAPSHFAGTLGWEYALARWRTLSKERGQSHGYKRAPWPVHPRTP